MLMLKRNRAAKSEPQTKTEQAIKHRKAQGRGPLDHWDMFANVMATRNSLSPDHPNHMSLLQVTAATAMEVHRATHLPLPDNFTVSDGSGHASTNGGYRKSPTARAPITLKMKQNYGQNALDQITQNENTDAFRKMVRTVSHEMTHVQDLNHPMAAHTTVPEFETRAYGNEIASHPSLPALQGRELQSTARKFQNQMDELRRTRSSTVSENDMEANVQRRTVIGKGVGM